MIILYLCSKLRTICASSTDHDMDVQAPIVVERHVLGAKK